MFHHNLRNNHAPQKFEKRPCSIQKLIWPCLAKIRETTMLHKNLRSDHAPSKNFRSDHANLRNDHVPPEFEAICHILGEHGHINFSMEHGHFSNFCGAWSFLKFWWNLVILIFHQNLRNDNVPPEFEKWPCSTRFWGHFGGTRSYSFFDGAWSLFKFFDGTWSLLKFLWSMVVSQILVEHCHFYFFWWSMVLSQIFWHQSYHYH